MFSKTGSKILSFLLLLTLFACSSIQTPQSNSSSVQETNIPAAWTANGRLSVIRGEENWYARFSWVQQDDDFQIRFSGPVGETQLLVSQIGSAVRLKTPSVEKTGHDLEQLILQETGWVFPVRSLQYWLHGQAKPAIVAKIQYNDAGQVSEITQQGWKIDYSRWMLVAKTPVVKIRVPKKLIITHDDLKIKIIISQWLLAEQSLQLNL